MIDGLMTCHMETVDCSPRGDVSLLFSVSVSCSYKHTNSDTGISAFLSSPEQ